MFFFYLILNVFLVVLFVWASDMGMYSLTWTLLNSLKNSDRMRIPYSLTSVS